MKISATKLILILVLILVILQFIPVERDNPPVTGEITAGPEVMGVLKRSCYDCHSNETRWPWYAYVAPVSFLIAHDVEEGREHINFSAWSSYPEAKQRKIADEMLEEVGQNDMPLPMYLLLHSDAELSGIDRQTLKEWVNKTYGITVN